jgi:hypothetical protein
MKKDTQIKSRERVKDLAEVYTNEREVNAMLDLVEDYSYQVNKSFLEPACGNGNFLIEILNRKLKTILSLKTIRERKDEKHFQLFVMKALSKIYGLDICSENIHESRDRLKNRVVEVYKYTFSVLFVPDEFIINMNYVLERNIQVANALETDNIEFSDFRITDKFYFTEHVFKYSDIENERKTSRKVFTTKYFLELYENRDEIELLSEKDLTVFLKDFMMDYIYNNELKEEGEFLIYLSYLMLQEVYFHKNRISYLYNEKIFFKKNILIDTIQKLYISIEETKGFELYKKKKIRLKTN